MLWRDKQDANTVFCDIRHEQHMLPDKNVVGGHRTCEIKPMIVSDFTNLPFADGVFSLVLFDPPHLTHAGPNSWLARKYGVLRGAWRQGLADGFSECFRVLALQGTLLFKWSEYQVPVTEIARLAAQEPIVWNRPAKGQTHWLVFDKRR